MAQKIRLLFVDDEEEFTSYMRKRLEKREMEVDSFTDPNKALAETKGKKYDVGLLDLKMPGIDGEELLRLLKERDPSMEVIILTGHGTVQSAVSATRSGAYEYLLKPCEFDDLVLAITKAYAKRVKAVRKGREDEINKVISNSISMSPIEMLQQIRRINDSDD